MYNYLLLLFCICSISSVFCAKSKSSSAINDDTDIKRDANIANLLKSKATINLFDKNYTKYVLDRPRNYHAAILFTATSPKYQCEICVTTKQTYIEVAEYYQIQYEFENIDKSQRIAFFVVEVDNAREVFQNLQFETVPRFFILPPRDVSDAKLSISKYEVETRSLMMGAQSTIETIESSTNVKVCYVHLKLHVVYKFYIYILDSNNYKV